jgi:hypothetical protein
MRIWLSQVVFGWTPTSYDARRPGDPNRVSRPHEILAHAENVLSKSESEFSIADSIFALKRAINIRLRHLNEIYEFHELFSKEVDSLERLEQVGLARRFLIKQLFELRNDIEHKDASPPGAERARELVDATWYFLRTTDSACKTVLRGVMLGSFEEDPDGDSHFWLNFRVLPDQHERFKISGGLSLDLLSETEQSEFLLLEVDRLSKPIRPADPTSAGYMKNMMRGEDERFVVAQADLPPDLRRQIWGSAFATL